MKNLAASEVKRHTQHKMAVTKVGGTKYTWTPGSPKLEGTRPMVPIGWLRLCLYHLPKSFQLRHMQPWFHAS